MSHPSNFCHGLAALGRFLLRPAIAVPILGLIYLFNTVSMMKAVVANPERAARATQKDAGEYLDAAQAFAAGDFSMKYVRKRAHRQPLYPLLLAAALVLGGGQLAPLISVNILIGLLLLLLLYFGILQLFESPLVAAAVAVTFVASAVTMEEISSQTMTEPLHLFLLVAVIYGFLQYVGTRKVPWLWLTYAVCGVDYLARVNGLFIMASLSVTLFSWDVWLEAKETAAAPVRRFFRLVAIYAAAVLIFVIVAAPSWVPRVYHHGNPIFHGHLANFMWADSYQAAREQPPSSCRIYLATHSIPQMLQRYKDGFLYVCLEVPYRLGRVLHGFGLLGFIVALVKRNRTYRLLAVFAIVQIQPIIWTGTIDDHQRVVYPGVICFDWYFAAVAFAWIIAAGSRWLRSREGAAGSHLPAGEEEASVAV